MKHDDLKVFRVQFDSAADRMAGETLILECGGKLLATLSNKAAHSTIYVAEESLADKIERAVAHFSQATRHQAEQRN